MGEPRLFCGNRRRLGLEGISFPSQGSLDVPLTSITQENKFELQNIIVALMPGGTMLLTKLSPIPREQDLIYCSKKSPSSCHSYGCFRFNWYFSKYCFHPLSLFLICYSSKKNYAQKYTFDWLLLKQMRPKLLFYICYSFVIVVQCTVTVVVTV